MQREVQDFSVGSMSSSVVPNSSSGATSVVGVSGSSNGNNSSSNSTTQMLREFSSEILNKRELQFLGRPANHQTPCSKP